MFYKMGPLCRFAGSLGRNFRGSLHYDGGLTSFIPSIQGLPHPEGDHLQHVHA